MVATRRAKAEATARAFTTLDVEMLSGIASFGGRRELCAAARNGRRRRRSRSKS